MRSSCTRDGRCYRPLDLEYWVREAQDAVKAMEAATRRLDSAMSGLNKARIAMESRKP
jgi:hypothetical protein